MRQTLLIFYLQAQETFRLAYSLTYYTEQDRDADKPSFDAGPYGESLKRAGSASNLYPSPTESTPSPATNASGVLSFEDFYQWVNQTVPLLYECMGGFIYRRVCPGFPIPPTLRLPLPFLMEKSTIVEKNEQLFGLALASAKVGL